MDLEVATNFYNWLGRTIPIEANLEDTMMSRIMVQTIVVASYNAWEHVLGQRLENALIKQRILDNNYSVVNGRRCESYEESQAQVYEKVRRLQSRSWNFLLSTWHRGCVIAQGAKSRGKGKRLQHCTAVGPGDDCTEATSHYKQSCLPQDKPFG